ncbi:MAG: CHAP domain-containing protein [Acidimicrobiaceae bacterium]|nr:CHAP domain-containing protein [Acidimicrobiaceae bacterium]MXZ66273.1 CHAP domain-containing protein [Acidimicrobiaceae bacterium]MYF32370.1 CHAP domain-containing protein [Acidimicrobiaceae bacterium]MYG77470.1 CHAP domain-containing protein [Acidimicrobiaceae bacterium]MYJ85495.1 CHAP domain-containing protein [Acidimicrobiaceae bacterium]
MDHNRLYSKITPVKLIAALILAAVLAGTAIANASHASSALQVTTRGSDELQRYGGEWIKGERGNTGSDGFWYTYESSSYGYWYFGSLHGIFRASYYLPGRDAIRSGSCFLWWCDAAPPTASPQFHIQQQNDDDSWETIRHLRANVRDANNKYKTGWWYWNDIQLDGNIRVRLSKRFADDKYRLAVDSFSFRWTGELPKDTEILQEGNSAAGTLSQTYQDMFVEYKHYEYNDGRSSSHIKTNHETECGRIAPRSAVDWIKTYRGQGANMNAYTFPVGECTSWVQFRLRGTVIADFDNGYGHKAYGGAGGPWSDGNNWDENARNPGMEDNVGVKICNTKKDSCSPVVHGVAQWNAGEYGHVAFVEAVLDGGRSIVVSEMNNGGAEICHLTVRTIREGDSGPGVRSWPDNFIQFD